MVIYRPIDGIFQRPYMFQQLLSTEYAASVLVQKLQKSKLLWQQLNLYAFGSHFIFNFNEF
ncbi:hypothetical protein D3C76_1385230 [compost metagenome]